MSNYDKNNLPIGDGAPKEGIEWAHADEALEKTMGNSNNLLEGADIGTINKKRKNTLNLPRLTDLDKEDILSLVTGGTPLGTVLKGKRMIDELKKMDSSDRPGRPSPKQILEKWGNRYNKIKIMDHFLPGTKHAYEVFNRLQEHRRFMEGKRKMNERVKRYVKSTKSGDIKPLGTTSKADYPKWR